MTLELTQVEAAELGSALMAYLGELRMEIAGTDSFDYRQELKERRAVLTHVLEQVEQRSPR